MTTAVTDGKIAETGAMTTAKDGTLAFEEGNTVLRPVKTAQTNETVLGSSEKSAPKENDLPAVVKTESEMTEKPETMTAQDSKNSEIGRHKQTAAGENPMQEVIADAAKTAKSEIETDGINLERNGFQNSIQGAVSTRGAAEALPLSQLMNPVHFVAETAPLNRVLVDFYERHQHLFMVWLMKMLPKRPK